MGGKGGLRPDQFLDHLTVIKMFVEPDDEEKRVFPLVLHRSLARGRYILWMGKSVNLF